MKRLVMLLIVFLKLQGCQFVPLTAGGEKTRVLSAAEVRQCKQVGDTLDSTKADIWESRGSRR